MLDRDGQHLQDKYDTDLPAVIAAIKRIRSHVVIDEYKLHAQIAEELRKSGISFAHEVKIGPRERIDFLTEAGVGIEVKKGKPNEARVFSQLVRYASCPDVKAIVLVIERYMDVPYYVRDKRAVSIGLRKQWGIASK